MSSCIRGRARPKEKKKLKRNQKQTRTIKKIKTDKTTKKTIKLVKTIKKKNDTFVVTTLVTRDVVSSFPSVGSWVGRRGRGEQKLTESAADTRAKKSGKERDGKTENSGNRNHA